MLGFVRQVAYACDECGRIAISKVIEWPGDIGCQSAANSIYWEGCGYQIEAEHFMPEGWVSDVSWWEGKTVHLCPKCASERRQDA